MHLTGEDDSLALKKKVTIDDVFGSDLHIHDPDAKWLSGELKICLWHLKSVSRVKTQNIPRQIMTAAIVVHDSEYTTGFKTRRSLFDIVLNVHCVVHIWESSPHG